MNLFKARNQSDKSEKKLKKEKHQSILFIYLEINSTNFIFGSLHTKNT